jgi:RimJ/RimL family protein N-acetyltransferase
VASRLRNGSGRTSAGYALNTLQLRQVIADIDPENVASIAVAGKLGFTDAGPTMYAGRQVTRYAIERADELD